MKQIRVCHPVFIIMLLSFAAFSQNSRIGAFSYGGGSGMWHQNGVSSLDFKAPPNAFEIRGEFRQQKNGLVFVETEQFINGSWGLVTVAITNYPFSKDLVTGHSFYSAAELKGIITDEDGIKTECYEYFDLFAYRAELANKQEKLAEQKGEHDRQARKEASERAKAIALKTNQDAAAKGDTYGLMRMGERYRDGDEVEKDLSKARYYLQRAADAGSPTAKEELSKLEAK